MKIIIVGAYAIGTHLARLLSRNNHDTILIDSDENRLSNIGSDYDLMTIQASVSRIKTLTVNVGKPTEKTCKTTEKEDVCKSVKDGGKQSKTFFHGRTP